MTSECLTCGRTFTWNRPSQPQECCSRSCASRKPGRTKGGPKPQPRPVCVCKQCGTSFSKPKVSRGGVYCSRRCTGLAKRRSGLYVAKDGRAFVHLRENGRVQGYARCLMEVHLKRHLERDEVVHHINGDKSDDRLENLQIVTPSEHTRLHLPDLMAAQGKLLKAVPR